ncbi:MAG: rhodanese-like domain-containing protein [Sandaracinaceae bacterium]
MPTRISPQEADRRMREEGYVYLDVRSIPEFDEGHPTGAYNIPLLHAGAGGMQPNPDFVAEVEKVFTDRDAKIVVGCRSGGRSLNAIQMLERVGYTGLVDQRAGAGGARDPFGQVTEPGWQAAGLPWSSDAEPGRSYAELTGKRG